MPSIKFDLPHELLELIFDQIPQTKTGRRTLRSCLLVSTYFWQLSRNRLFRHLEVHPHEPTKVNGLRKLLEHEEKEEERFSLRDVNRDKREPVCSIHASLIRSVKSLKIIRAHSSSHYSGYMEDVEAILLMFAESQTLQGFEVSGRGPTNFLDLVKWNFSLQSLLKILDSPLLECLVFDNISSIPHNAFDIWRIKDLALLHVTVSEKSAKTNTITPFPVAPRPNSRLRSFTYVFQYPLASQWLNHPSPFSTLSALTAKFDYRRHALPNKHFDSFLKISGGSLRTLHIDFDNVSPSPFIYIFDLFPHSLQNFTTLWELKFTVYSFFHEDWEVDGVIVDQPVPNAVKECKIRIGRTGDVVKSLDTFNLEKVPDSLHTIEVEFHVRKALVKGVRFRKETDWQELGDKLMESRFGSVRDIRISFVIDIKTAALEESLDVDAPFSKEFPDLWMNRYPSIPIKVVKVEKWREGSM